MCKCCEMKRTPSGGFQGSPIPDNNIHVDTKGMTMRICYDTFIEHFYLWVSIKGLFKSKSQIHPLTCCPNCGSNLFAVWDTTRR